MNHDDDIDWSVTTWEGNRRQLLEYWASLTLDEVFEAQEEMAAFAEEFNRTKDAIRQHDAASLADAGHTLAGEVLRPEDSSDWE